MGMYDHIDCQYPLPDGYTGQRFQTKDFDCRFETYHITPDGRLFAEDVHWEEIPKVKRPYPDAESGSFQEFWTSMKIVVERTYDKNFHGILNFYDNEREFRAKFTDGQLVEIVKVEE